MEWSQNKLPNIISNRKVMKNINFWPQNFLAEERKKISVIAAYTSSWNVHETLSEFQCFILVLKFIQRTEKSQHCIQQFCPQSIVTVTSVKLSIHTNECATEKMHLACNAEYTSLFGPVMLPLMLIYNKI